MKSVPIDWLIHWWCDEGGEDGLIDGELWLYLARAHPLLCSTSTWGDTALILQDKYSFMLINCGGRTETTAAACHGALSSACVLVELQMTCLQSHFPGCTAAHRSTSVRRMRGSVSPLSWGGLVLPSVSESEAEWIILPGAQRRYYRLTAPPDTATWSG